MTTLLPEDVPGALLRDELSLEDHSILQLSRWLECRGLKKSGTKAELITRIKNCIQAGNDNNILPGVDGGRWYEAKMNQELDSQSTTNSSQVSLNNINWSEFPSTDIPQFFNKGHIYTYMMIEDIENVNPEINIRNDETSTSVKPFRRGHQYVDSDHISQIEDGQYKNIYACRCLCLSSFKKTVKYKVGVTLHKISGAVKSGTCDCKQSSLGKCSHVNALLLFICEYVEKYGHTRVASTSKPREWGLGSQKRNPKEIKKAEYPIKKYKPTARAQYDPRPPNCIKEPNWNNFIVNLQKGGVNSMFESILKVEYENFTYTREDSALIGLQTELFLTNMRIYADNQPTSLFEVPHTIPQGSEEWLRWRTFYITSSNAKIVTSQLKSDQAKKNFLLKNLWRMTPPVLTVAMQYGKKNESKARTEYSNTFLKGTQRLVEYGLMVNRKYPYFATSVDGCVCVGNDVQYVIEIKCPKVLEKCTKIIDFDKFLSKDQLNIFFLEKEGAKIKIKRTHPYLYQMLMSLIIFDLRMCHLVVWSPKSMLVVPVYKENYSDIIDDIKQRAKNFYCNIYVPEIFTMRTVRDLFPIDFKMYE